MPKKVYKVPVYNEATGEFETVCFTKEQYNAFRRSEWAIENKNRKFIKHEILFSDLVIGRDKDDVNDTDPFYENFHEFASHEDDPGRIIEDLATSVIISDVLSELKESELALILALIVYEKSERDYADELGEYQVKIHRKKKELLEILRSRLETKEII
jgi:hypothetical protein